MREKPSEYLEKRRIRSGPMSSTPAHGNNGRFTIWRKSRKLHIQASDQKGWEHVSVSIANNPQATPTWEDMCFVKGLFWYPDEWVIQYHPAQSDYINVHPGVVHLWKPVDVELPKPPIEFV